MSSGRHAIGEVVSLLAGEHPDVTVNKIRLLEKHGLIKPERTSGGHRIYNDSDVARLDWILAQQSQHKLPLKVIRSQLSQPGFEPRRDDSTVGAGAAREPAWLVARGPDRTASGVETGTAQDAETDAGTSSDPGLGPGRWSGAGVVSISLDASELTAAAGIDSKFLTELIDLGLIQRGADQHFDHEALIVARAAGACAEHGMQARHLRMFKIATDREAGLFEQLIVPLKSRGDVERANTLAGDLIDLGDTIRRSLLRRTFGPLPD